MPSLNRAALLKHADLCIRQRAYLQAQSICEELLRADKHDAEAWYVLSRVHIINGRYEDAVKLLKKCLSRHPKEVRFLTALGGAHTADAKHDLAIEAFTKALKLNPNDLHTLAGLVGAYEKLGDIEKAKQLLEPVVDQCGNDAYLGRAYALIAMADKRPQDAVNILVRNGAVGPIPRASCYILGKAYEKLKDYDNSFRAYTMANQAEVVPFDLDKFIAEIDELMEVFCEKNLARLPRATIDSTRAVFVTGRPRSGTTLVSKIIAAHPDSADVGEITSSTDIVEQLNLLIESTLPYPKTALDLDQNDVNMLCSKYLGAVEAIAGWKAPRIVDKNLYTPFHLGLISLILPNAHVVHCRRDPIDNSLACYTEQLIGSYTYANDLRSLGLTHWLTERLWRHWHEVLDIPILDVNYEDVVEDQDGMSRKIIEFVGLPWNDACLKFYEAEKGKPRSTAALTYSYDQVRKPIYKTSIGRAAGFKKHLAPLHEALAEGEARWGAHATAAAK